MRIGNLSFAPGLWPTLAFLPLLAALLALGVWQLDRAEQKRVLQHTLARGEAAAPVPLGLEPPPRHTRVRVAGRWDPSRQVLLDAMTHAGQVGYRVLTPLLRDNAPLLLVDRGWVPADADRARLPAIAVEAREVEITGLTDGFPVPALRTADAAPAAGGWPRVMFFPTLAALEAAYGAPVHPQRLLLDAAEPDGFERTRGKGHGFGAERHVGYAITWFALALTLAGLYVALNLRRMPGV